MKIALVHYDVSRIANEPGNKTVMKHFGHMPNIQLLYVAAVLEQLDVELEYYDMVGMEIDENELKSRLTRFNPDIVAISIFTSHFHNAMSYARFFKSFIPQTKVLIGGIHTSIFPTESLEYIPEVDYACVGEAEMVMPEFLRRLRAGESLEGMKGLVWRNEKGEVRYNGPADLCMDLDSVPFPARHLVPNEVYFNFISTYRNYTVFNTSRGCPFQCVFCESSGTKWRARSAENVFQEIVECYEKYGVREVDIFDSSFTVSKSRVLELCDMMEQSGLAKKVRWDVRSRVDTIDEEMLDALAAGGCYRIFYGIESADPAILETLRKGIKLSRVEEIVRKTDKVGISAFGYFLLGAPGETHETANKTIEFAKSLPLDFAIFNCLTAFPQTPLYDKYYLPFVEHDFWSDYITQTEAPTEFMGRPWTDLTHDELMRMAHKAMNEYYFRPSQMWRAVRSVRSFDQFKRYSLAGIDMVKSYVTGL